MGTHIEHNMKLTSLYAYWGNYDEDRFNERFRQDMERYIIKLHLKHPEGLTDEELGDILELQLGKKLDTDIYRPRRCDLSTERRGKNGNLLRPSFLKDSGIKKRNKWDRLMIVWVLNEENLNSYLGSE